MKFVVTDRWLSRLRCLLPVGRNVTGKARQNQVHGRAYSVLLSRLQDASTRAQQGVYPHVYQLDLYEQDE